MFRNRRRKEKECERATPRFQCHVLVLVGKPITTLLRLLYKIGVNEDQNFSFAGTVGVASSPAWVSCVQERTAK